jgi:hypothetical protein
MVPLMDATTTPLGEVLNPADADTEGRRILLPVVFFLQMNAVHLPGNNKSSPPEKKMSIEHPNEMLA